MFEEKLVENNEDPTLLKATDVAKRLRISRSLAYRLMQTRVIPIVKINSLVRVRPEDLEIYIQTNLTVNDA